MFSIKTAILTCLLVWTSQAAAGEFVARAKVLSAEPIIEMTSRKVANAACAQGKPATTDLVRLLEWDLSVGHCKKVYQQDRRVTGYTVRYEWQDQVFTQVTNEDPGQYLPLKVRVD